MAKDQPLASDREPSIDFLLLADRAEALNGKLYVMGGAWDRIAVPKGQTTMISFALGIMVPWHGTNQQHRFVITMEDEDGQAVDFRGEGVFTAGRPPFLAPGETQRVILAATAAPVTFPHPGRYNVKARVNLLPAKCVQFTVSFIDAPSASIAPSA